MADGRSPTAAMPPGMPSALGHPSMIWPTASIGNCCKQPPSRQEGPIRPGHLARLDELAEVYVSFYSRWKYESMRPGARRCRD